MLRRGTSSLRILIAFIVFGSLPARAFDMADLTQRYYDWTTERRAAKDARAVREDFLSAEDYLNQALSENQQNILAEVGELYAEARKAQEDLQTAIETNFVPGELDRLQTLAGLLSTGESPEQLYDAYHYTGETLSVFEARLQEWLPMLSENPEGLAKKLLWARMKVVLDNGGPRISTPVGRAKVTRIDDEVVVRVVHNQSRISFLMVPRERVSEDSAHFKLYSARQNYDTKVPTAGSPNGSVWKQGMDSVVIWTGESAAGETTLERIDVHRKRFPIPFTPSWRRWLNGTWRPATKEKVAFGIAACGVVQVGISGCFSGANHYLHGEHFEMAKIAIPMMWNFIYGSLIGMVPEFYANFIKRGNPVLQASKSLGVSYSFSLLLATSEHRIFFHDATGAFLVGALGTHANLILNSVLNNPLRYAWSKVANAIDESRIYNVPFQMSFRIPGIDRAFKIRLDMKKNHVINQLETRNAPWTAKTGDLLVHTPYQFLGIDLPMKVLMIAAVPGAPAFANWFFNRKMNEPRHASNEALKRVAARYKGEWERLSAPVRRLWERVVDIPDENAVAADVARYGTAEVAPSGTARRRQTGAEKFFMPIAEGMGRAFGLERPPSADEVSVAPEDESEGGDINFAQAGALGKLLHDWQGPERIDEILGLSVNAYRSDFSDLAAKHPGLYTALRHIWGEPSQREIDRELSFLSVSADDPQVRGRALALLALVAVFNPDPPEREKRIFLAGLLDASPENRKAALLGTRLLDFADDESLAELHEVLQALASDDPEPSVRSLAGEVSSHLQSLRRSQHCEQTFLSPIERLEQFSAMLAARPSWN